jgi:coiled-coil domain-containing protein 61
MIEQLCAKTGSKKTFKTFSKMIVSALEKTSDAVQYDILNAEQLEALRTHSRLNQSSNMQSSQRLINNRYFILSYKVEFDKVNFPLVLNYDEISNPKELKEILDQI